MPYGGPKSQSLTGRSFSKPPVLHTVQRHGSKWRLHPCASLNHPWSVRVCLVQSDLHLGQKQERRKRRRSEFLHRSVKQRTDYLNITFPPFAEVGWWITKRMTWILDLTALLWWQSNAWYPLNFQFPIIHIYTLHSTINSNLNSQFNSPVVIKWHNLKWHLLLNQPTLFNLKRYIY